MEVLHQLIIFFSNYGYLAVFCVLLACGFGLPIPEDITLVAGGVICGAFEANLDVRVMTVIALCGVVIGDSIMFMLGKFLGPKVKTLPVLRKIFTERIYKKMQSKVHRYGHWVLFVARFLPGLRAPIFMTAGISRKVPYWKFLLMDGAAALISVPIWVYAGYYFAHDLDRLVELVKHSEKMVIYGAIIVIVLFAFIVWLRKRNKKRANLHS